MGDIADNDEGYWLRMIGITVQRNVSPCGHMDNLRDGDAVDRVTFANGTITFDLSPGMTARQIQWIVMRLRAQFYNEGVAAGEIAAKARIRDALGLPCLSDNP